MEESLDSGRRLTNRLHTYQGYVFEVGRSTVIGEDKSSEDVELLGLNGQDGRPWRGASAGREGLARDGDFVRVPGSEAGAAFLRGGAFHAVIGAFSGCHHCTAKSLRQPPAQQ